MALVPSITRLSDRLARVPPYQASLSDFARFKGALVQQCRELSTHYGRGLLEQKRRTLWDQVWASPPPPPRVQCWRQPSAGLVG